MYGMFHRHVAAAVVMLTVTGSALAQSSDNQALQRAGDAPSTDSSPASAATPETQPPAGADLSKAPIATALSGEDAAVAERLRDLIATKLNRSIDRKQDRAAIEAFYRNRGFAPLWVANGAANDRAKDAMAFLRGVAADGLDPADYPAPRFEAGGAEARAQDEIALTNSILNFARHASTGRISFSRVSGAIYYDLKFPDPANVLADMTNAGNIREALDSYHPQHQGYQALKAKLAEARAQKSADVDTLIANMERWRWLPRDLGKAHVTVNVPDYTLKVTDQGKTVWSTRIVVGKPGEQATPLLSETMKFITVNPTWNVPPSIIRNEYLPALQRDPGALERIGLKIARNSDGTIRVYQPPGEKNALGRIRFNFPNMFLVYQHDTPQKHLFAKEQRAYSHGCMRVQHPEKYAEVLLSISQPGEGFNAERIRKMYGSSERTINFKQAIPVHLTYQTAFVDDAGRLQTRSDVYGHDRTILNLLRNDRRNADTPIARNYHSSSKPVVAQLPGRADPYAQDRRMDRTMSLRNERMVGRFGYGPGYLRPAYGIPY